MQLDSRQKYLQIAFNRSWPEVEAMVLRLPAAAAEYLIVEAGTPFIKQYGADGIRRLAELWHRQVGAKAYIVADLKCMDRGFVEVWAVKDAGASAATVLGLAPIATIDAFIAACREAKLDSMVDMMNVEFPFEVLQQLKVQPDVVVLHLGADEKGNKAKTIPYHQITRIKGAYESVISIAGGETFAEAQRAFFNGAGIAVVWKEFFDSPDQAAALSEKFLLSIKGYGKRNQ